MAKYHKPKGPTMHGTAWNKDYYRAECVAKHSNANIKHLDKFEKHSPLWSKKERPYGATVGKRLKKDKI